MQGGLDYVSEWSKMNDMNLNKPKTKFMENKFSLSDQAHPLMLEGEISEKVNTVKLLGIHIQDDLKWKINLHCTGNFYS